jgi:hypothetical protein
MTETRPRPAELAQRPRTPPSVLLGQRPRRGPGRAAPPPRLGALAEQGAHGRVRLAGIYDLLTNNGSAR